MKKFSEIKDGDTFAFDNTFFVKKDGFESVAGVKVTYNAVSMTNKDAWTFDDNDDVLDID